MQAEMNERSRAAERNAAVGLADSGWASGTGNIRSSSPAVALVETACQQMARLVRRLPATAGLAGMARSAAQAIVDACALDGDAARGAIRLLGRRYPYVVRHPLHVAIVAQLLGRYHGLTETALRSLAGAAVTMNLSIVRLQERLYAQASSPDESQRQQLRAHPLASAQLLEEAGITDSRWLRMVREHHERLDGSGYPGGLRHDDLDAGSRILLFADYFCARLSHRSYRRGMLPDRALRHIFVKPAGIAARPDAQSFIKLLGLYPPGSFVRLENGETAIVIRLGSDSGQLLVLSLSGPDGHPLPAPHQRNTAAAGCGVVAAVNDEEVKMNIPPDLVWPASA